MNHFGEEDVRVERIWCGETIGTKLSVEHVLSGMVVERVIGLDDETARCALCDGNGGLIFSTCPGCGRVVLFNKALVQPGILCFH